MANMWEYDITVSKFEFQLHNYIHFQTNTGIIILFSQLLVYKGNVGRVPSRYN